MSAPTIHRNMTVREIISLVPVAADIMLEYGLHCFSCSVGGVETLEQGCHMHSMDDETIEALVDDINDAIGKAPKRPQTLVITKEAARAIGEIAEKENRVGQILVVTVDENGGFCLEFQKEPLQGDMDFTCSDVPEVRIYASVLTLSRIGGATIDVRDGRFKLDVPEEEGGCCKGNDGACDCL